MNEPHALSALHPGDIRKQIFLHTRKPGQQRQGRVQHHTTAPRMADRSQSPSVLSSSVFKLIMGQLVTSAPALT